MTQKNGKATRMIVRAVAVLAANVAAGTHQTHYFKPEDFKVPPRKSSQGKQGKFKNENDNCYDPCRRRSGGVGIGRLPGTCAGGEGQEAVADRASL